VLSLPHLDTDTDTHTHTHTSQQCDYWAVSIFILINKSSSDKIAELRLLRLLSGGEKWVAGGGWWASGGRETWAASGWVVILQDTEHGT